MLGLVIIATVSLTSICGDASLTPHVLSIKKQMTQNTEMASVHVNAMLLEVYEDQTAPLGPKLGSNRPIGHAIVRLRIESLSLEPVTLEDMEITIQQPDQSQHLMLRSVGSLHLGGRQIVEPGFRLTNRQGFMGADRIKAVVTYRLRGKSYTVASPVMAVTVNP